MEINGVQITIYSIGYLAKALHRSSACIRKWELKEIIPPPVLKPDVHGRRWYTEDEIHMIQRIMEQENVRNGCSFAKTQFSTRVKVEMLAIRQKFQAMLAATTQKGLNNANASTQAP